jgi:hypothetical protein
MEALIWKVVVKHISSEALDHMGNGASSTSWR